MVVIIIMFNISVVPIPTLQTFNETNYFDKSRQVSSQVPFTDMKPSQVP